MKISSKIKSPDLRYKEFLKKELSFECLKKTNVKVLRQKISRRTTKIVEERPQDEKFIKRLLKIPKGVRILEIRDDIINNPKLYEQIWTQEWKIMFLKSLNEKELIKFYQEKYMNHGYFMNRLSQYNPTNLHTIVELLEITNPEDIVRLTWIITNANPKNLIHLILMLEYQIKRKKWDEIIDILADFELLLMEANPKNLEILHNLWIIRTRKYLLKFKEFLSEVNSINFKIFVENTTWKNTEIKPNNILTIKELLTKSEVNKKWNSNLLFFMKYLYIQNTDWLYFYRDIIIDSKYENLELIFENMLDKKRNMDSIRYNLTLLSRLRRELIFWDTELLREVFIKNKNISVDELIKIFDE